jgi:hypothetical protein
MDAAAKTPIGTASRLLILAARGRLSGDIMSPCSSMPTPNSANLKRMTHCLRPVIVTFERSSGSLLFELPTSEVLFSAFAGRCAVLVGQIRAHSRAQRAISRQLGW